MAQLTITEALSEIKLVQGKVLKKQLIVTSNLHRAAHVKDPFEKEGGSAKAMTSEVQAIADLQTRLTRIRAGIAEANLKNSITIGNQTRTIFEWLTWKREVAQSSINFHTQIVTGLKVNQDNFALRPQFFKDADDKPQMLIPVPSLDYAEYVKKVEDLSSLLEQVDGKLSLKNATIIIDA